MFELVLLKDLIRVDPSNFGQDRLDALMLEIDLKYCNKVLQNVGLFHAVSCGCSLRA